MGRLILRVGGGAAGCERRDERLMLNRRTRLVLALAALALGLEAGRADDSRKPDDPALDEGLLEFLGSVDPSSDAAQSEDGSWIDYLARTDIGRVVKPAAAPARGEAKPPAPAAQPSGSQDGRR